MSSTRLGITSNDAALFAKVAQTLSFKDAADALGISRSAVSKRIARLETNLGATLVNRSSRSLSLSELGGVLSILPSLSLYLFLPPLSSLESPPLFDLPYPPERPPLE